MLIHFINAVNVINVLLDRSDTCLDRSDTYLDRSDTYLDRSDTYSGGMAPREFIKGKP